MHATRDNYVLWNGGLAAASDGSAEVQHVVASFLGSCAGEGGKRAWYTLIAWPSCVASSGLIPALGAKMLQLQTDVPGLRKQSWNTYLPAGTIPKVCCNLTGYIS